MPTEQNHGITFGFENFRCFYKDGLLVAIEKENGVIERYFVERSTNALSNRLFSLDIVQQSKKPTEVKLEHV